MWVCDKDRELKILEIELVKVKCLTYGCHRGGTAKSVFMYVAMQCYQIYKTFFRYKDCKVKDFVACNFEGLMRYVDNMFVLGICCCK